MKNKTSNYVKLLLISLNALIVLSLVLLVWSYRYIFSLSEILFIESAVWGSTMSKK